MFVNILQIFAVKHLPFIYLNKNISGSSGRMELEHLVHEKEIKVLTEQLDLLFRFIFIVRFFHFRKSEVTVFS